jgi:formylglycine-generating enzyme required for sulfatase activity
MRNLYFIPFILLLLAFSAMPPNNQARQEQVSNSIGMTFVLIEPGRFQMGSPKDAPMRDPSEKPHEVQIDQSFYMQTTEVTLGQWWEVMGKKWLFPRKGPAEIPVTEVSWHDCQAFIKELNEREDAVYRLPTEAEWEYACRAGSQSAYFWGDQLDCRRAMYANSRKSDKCVPVVREMGLFPNRPAPVKSYPPNPWGLYDMHGNVWEWIQDCFKAYPYEPDRDARCSRRVRRGGSWYSNPRNLRCANRAYAHPSAKFETTGFRLVKEP